jgi:hypothetical protein
MIESSRECIIDILKQPEATGYQMTYIYIYITFHNCIPAYREDVRGAVGIGFMRL